MRSRPALPVLLAALVVASAGCSDGSPSSSRASTSRTASAKPSPSGTGSSATASPTGTVTSPPGATSTPTAAAPPTTTGPITTTSEQESFGSTVTYSDAVTVAIGPPRVFPPSSFAWTGGDFPAYVRMTITVVNGSGQPLFLDRFHVAVTSGGAEGQRVIDADDGLGDPAAAGQLAPGQESEFDVAFGINDPADLTVEAAPSFDAPRVTWTSN